MERFQELVVRALRAVGLVAPSKAVMVLAFIVAAWVLLLFTLVYPNPIDDVNIFLYCAWLDQFVKVTSQFGLEPLNQHGVAFPIDLCLLLALIDG